MLHIIGGGLLFKALAGLESVLRGAPYRGTLVTT